MNLYSDYFRQNILWLQDGFRHYYVQRPGLLRRDIVDVKLKRFRDPEEAVDWLACCVQYDAFYTLLHLRSFLSDHSPGHEPVFRHDDRTVLGKVADLLGTNRHAIVEKPKYLTATLLVDPASIFAHILGHKPGDVYDWGQGAFTQNARQFGHALTDGENAYLAHFDLARIEAGKLTDPQTTEAAGLFGNSPKDRAQYANWRTRARIINHYRFTHPATINGLMTSYRLARDSNPLHFALERGWQIGGGKEMFTGLKVSRLQAGLELLLSIGVVKLLGLRSKPNRMATDNGAAEAQPLANQGRPGKTTNVVKKSLIDGKQFKRNHLDGDPKDPYTLMPDGKPMGAEVGKVPATLQGLKKLPKNHDKYVKDGWPDLNAEYRKGQFAEDFRNFTDAKPDNLKPDTKIYRIVDEGSTEFKDGVSGSYWTTELPKNKTAWRKDYAVKDSWNDNGYFIEETVGPEGLKVWRGGTAAQKYWRTNFFLKGGQEQIFVNRGSITSYEPQMTNWPDL